MTTTTITRRTELAHHPFAYAARSNRVDPRAFSGALAA